MSSKRRIKVNIQYCGLHDAADQQGTYQTGASYGGPACLPIEVMGLLPQHDYIVTYIEDPIGEFVVTGFHQLSLVGGPAIYATVCFLPLDWPVGLRVRRVVT